MNNFQFRKAEHKDSKQIAVFYEEVIDHLEETVNYPLWLKHVYPNEDTAVSGIEQGALYVLMEEENIAASVILNHIQPGPYQKLEWKYEKGRYEFVGEVDLELNIPGLELFKCYEKKM